MIDEIILLEYTIVSFHVTRCLPDRRHSQWFTRGGDDNYHDDSVRLGAQPVEQARSLIDLQHKPCSTAHPIPRSGTPTTLKRGLFSMIRREARHDGNTAHDPLQRGPRVRGPVRSLPTVDAHAHMGAHRRLFFELLLHHPRKPPLSFLDHHSLFSKNDVVSN